MPAPLHLVYFNTAHRWIGEAASTDLLARVMVATSSSASA